MNDKTPLLCCAAVASAALGCRRSATERPPGPVVSALFALAADFGADADATTRAFASLQDIARRVENVIAARTRTWPTTSTP